MTTPTLNIAQICPSTSALGPGKRFVVWVQGCPFHCPACVAPDWIPFKTATPVPVENLARSIISQPGVDGVTLSGGEPMMQAGQLARLVQLVRDQRPELSVIVFSGFTLPQLVWTEARELLSAIDLLVDGQYVQSLNDNRGLRGSSNQQFHFFTDRLLPFRDEIVNQRFNLEFHLQDDGVLMAGIPPQGFSW